MMFHRFTPRHTFLAAMIMAFIAPAFASGGRAQEAGVVADDAPITERDIEQRSKLMEAATHKTPPREEVLESLQKESSIMHDARKLGLEVSDSELNKGYADIAVRMGLTPDKLDQLLAKQGIGADTLKRRVRAQIAWKKYERALGHPRN
jgi:peptidyl-prolyl cis-trans isomerase SurA